MSYSATAERAARDQLSRLGGPYAYTKRESAVPLTDPALIAVFRNVVFERPGFDVPVVERRHVASFLNSQVGKPKRGDIFRTDTEWWIVDQVIDDDGWITQAYVFDDPVVMLNWTYAERPLEWENLGKSLGWDL